MLPGISKKSAMELEPKIQRIIVKHVKAYKRLLKEKERFLSDKDPKEVIFGFGGFKKIDDFIRKTEGPSEDKLIVLKNLLLSLKTLVDREILINRDFEELGRKGKTDKTLAEQLERLKAEFADELILVSMVNKQAELVDQIHETISELTPLSKQKELSAYCAELDNFCMLLKNSIMEKEITTLDLINNLVNIPRLLDLKKRKTQQEKKKKSLSLKKKRTQQEKKKKSLDLKKKRTQQRKKKT